MGSTVNPVNPPQREAPFTKSEVQRITDWQSYYNPKYFCPTDNVLLRVSVNGLYCETCNHIQYQVDAFVLTATTNISGIPMNSGYYSMSGGAIVSASLNSFLNHRRGAS